MNTQTMLVLGALAIIGTVSLMVNRTLLDTSAKVTESNVSMTALGIAEALISEAMLRRYDENPNATTLALFCPAVSLGPEAGENYPDFDDVDDYKNLLRTTTINGTVYTIRADVNYVSDTDLKTIQSNPTYSKLLTLKVSSTYLRAIPDSAVTLNYLAPYVRLFQ